MKEPIELRMSKPGEKHPPMKRKQLREDAVDPFAGDFWDCWLWQA